MLLRSQGHGPSQGWAKAAATLTPLEQARVMQDWQSVDASNGASDMVNGPSQSGTFQRLGAIELGIDQVIARPVR